MLTKQCGKGVGLVLDPLILCSKHTPQWSSPAIFIFQYLWPLQVGARWDVKGKSETAVSEHLSSLAASLGTMLCFSALTSSQQNQAVLYFVRYIQVPAGCVLVDLLLSVLEAFFLFNHGEFAFDQSCKNSECQGS